VVAVPDIIGVVAAVAVDIGIAGNDTVGDLFKRLAP
jgi:hypothetical protein